METRTHGPFVFKGYKNSARFVAILESATGKTFEVSSSNLVPLRGRSKATPTFDDVVWEDNQPGAMQYDTARH